MYHLNNRLNDLNDAEPITKEIRALLIDFSTTQTSKNLFALLKPGQYATKIWKLQSGYVIAVKEEFDGTWDVMDIYTPGAIITDVLSFFHGKPVVHKYLAIGQIKVLELTKKDYDKLNEFPETARLVQLLMIDTIKTNEAKSKMYLLPPRSMIICFFKDYNICNLPDKYCASFLRLSLEKYMELKVNLLKSGEIELSPKDSKYQYKTHNMQVVYEVREYILEVYGLPDFKNIIELAKLFNTSKKVLTEQFKKVLGITAHRLVLELRMAKALTLLSKDKRPIKEVYKEVGFKDVYHFSKRFKHYHGYSPKIALTMD